MIVNAYFSNIRSEIISSLSCAKNHIMIAMAWFTNNEFMDELVELIHKGVRIDLILLDDELNHALGADFNRFKQEGGNLYLYPKDDKFMHNKYCIVDNCLVITGSYNWTNYAEYRNCENVVISDDNSLIKSYKEDFEELLERSMTCGRFEVLPIVDVDCTYFRSHVADFAQEIYCYPTQNNRSEIKNTFDRKLKDEKIALPKDVILFKEKMENKTTHSGDSVIPSQQAKSIETPKPSVVVTEVKDFKYAVSKYNIGFKAKLIDQNMREGLKVLVNKGQALPFTITQDSKSANSGDSDSMSANCELYYGETTELSDCQKFDLSLTMNNLPKMNEGEVKFKVIVSLNELGKLTVNFVCVNTKTGEKGSYVSEELVEFKNP